WNGKRRLSGVPHLFSNQKGTITENQFSLTFWTAPSFSFIVSLPLLLFYNSIPIKFQYSLLSI
ncbi:hypothetical protein ACFQ38_07900, partial [Sporosarcina contaminans]